MREAGFAKWPASRHPLPPDAKMPSVAKALEGNLRLRLFRRRLVVEAGVEPANGIAELIYSQRPLATWIFHHQKNERRRYGGVPRFAKRFFVQTETRQFNHRFHGYSRIQAKLGQSDDATEWHGMLGVLDFGLLRMLCFLWPVPAWVFAAAVWLKIRVIGEIRGQTQGYGSLRRHPSPRLPTAQSVRF